MLNAKQVFKETYKNFKKIDGLLEQIVDEISSDEFVTFTQRTKKLVKIL